MQSGKRVLFITHVDTDGSSGANIATKEIINALSRITSLTLISPSDSDYDGYNSENLPKKERWGVLWHILVQPILIYKIIVETRQNSPQIIVARYHSTLLFPGILSRLLNIEYVFLVRGRPFRGLSYRWLLPLAVVNIYLNSILSSKIIVAYDQIAKDIAKLPVLSSEKVVVRSNAVDTAKFEPEDPQEVRSKYNIPESAFVVGLVSSLKEWHSGEELIKAAKELSGEIDIRILIVGDGPQKETLEHTAQKKGLGQQTIFTGFVDHEKVSKYMSACDVLFGVVSGGNPIKCYEYLACARPIISSEQPEFDFVEDEDLGITIADIEAEAIAHAIRGLYKQGKKERQEMGKRGRRYVIENHTWDHLAREVVNLNND